MTNTELFYGTNLSLVDSFMNEKKSHNAVTVVRGLEKFIDDNFRSLAEITVDLPGDATLFISVESLAMFFSDVISFVFGRALLKLNFYVQDKKMFLHIEPEPYFECSFDEISRLIRFARDVGFDVLRLEDKTVFTIDCYSKTGGTIYAPTFKSNVDRIAEIFENAFLIHMMKNENANHGEKPDNVK